MAGKKIKASTKSRRTVAVIARKGKKGKTVVSVQRNRANNGGAPNLALNGLAGAAGSAIGNLIAPGIGGTIGNVLGRGAHTLFKTITGLGDYKINSNTVASDTVPKFTSTGKGMRVAHREYIGDIVSSSNANTFSISTFPIQPGSVGTFPWLSGLATLFQVYKMHGLVFEFKTTSSDALNSTNTALGTIILATQYNVLDPVFTNKQQMENSDFSVSAKPSCSVLHPVECNPVELPLNHLYVRGPTSNPSGDLRFTDMGNFSIATTGLQGTSVNLGELWCSYDVEFLRPIIQSAISSNTGFTDHYRMDSSITSGHPFGTTPTLKSGSNFGTTIATNSNIIVIPQYVGEFMVVYTYTGASGGTSGPTYTAGGNATALSVLNGANFALYANASTGQTVLMSIAMFSSTGGGTVTLGAHTPLGTITAGDCFVITMPNGLS